MKVVSDLHLHSKYSRAVSPQMTLPIMAEWAEKKGINLVGSGDFTHPMWLREIESNLEEAEKGIYKLKSSSTSTRFLLTSEISSIYSQGGKTRKIHLVVLAPNLAAVTKINQGLTNRGANLFSDGRPIVGLSAKQVAEIVFSADPRCLVIPAHAWTPHFSLYGSVSGFNSIEECFGDLTKYISAIESGLSSDPGMNWRIEELTNRSIVSFSDAHSPAKLGREATVFEMPEISFENLRKMKIVHTIEFYPEEGKYHFTGHRNCKVIYSPNETRKKGTTCPVCGRGLTVGVMSRVEKLASQEVETETEKDKFGVRWIYPKGRARPPYVMLVPLMEILSEALGSGVGSQKVVNNYELLVNNFGSEFKVLLETKIEEIEKVLGEKVGEAISKVRSGDIHIEPGYDGVFGKVKIWSDTAGQESRQNLSSQQNSLF